MSLAFPCTDMWTGPSSLNEFDCGNIVPEFVAKSQVWSAVVPLAIGLLILFPLSCILMCGRYCCNCCGSARMRPSSLCGGTCSDTADPDEQVPEAVRMQMYSDACICVVRGMCLLLGAVAVVGVVLNVTGGAKISSGVDDIKPTLENVVQWAVGVLDEIKIGVADPNNATQYPNGFDAQMFDSVESTILDYQKDANKQVDEFSGYIKTAATVIGYVAFAPAAILLLPLLAALLCVRKVLPCVSIALSFLFQFIYFLFSTICILLVVIFGLLYDDLSSTEPSQRSVLQWYLVPRCDSEAPFNDAKRNLAMMEQEASTAACQELLKVCNNDTNWNPMGGASQAELVFYCNLTNSSACATVDNVSSVVDSMYIKTTVPAALACGAEAAAKNLTCDLELCATNCTSSDARNAASLAVDRLSLAKRVLNVYHTVLLPWMSCDALLEHVISLGLYDLVKKIRDGTHLIEVGSLILAASLAASVLVWFLGQKRFINKSAAFRTTADSGDEEGHNMSATKMGSAKFPYAPTAMGTSPAGGYA